MLRDMLGLSTLVGFTMCFVDFVMWFGFAFVRVGTIRAIVSALQPAPGPTG